ncbi:hypothetical protein [Herbiconiux liangxiaofengii]|uniref:hypothetical protein n=1 Tax=Herbiconiux liangxiaofengii TaxID=3342795 RepID=UPI0035B9B8A5
MTPAAEENMLVSSIRQMMNRARAAGLFVVAAGGALALSACTTSYQALARTDDGGVTILICDDRFVVDVDNSSMQGPGMDMELWSASGPGLTAPFEVTYGVLPDSWSASMDPEPLATEGALTVLFGQDGETQTVAAFDIARLSDEWMTRDDRRAAEGCSDFEG